MTIAEALTSLNTFPILPNQIEKICIDRELDCTSDYDNAVGSSEAFELATADTYYWLHKAPSIVEQEVGVNQAIAIKQDFLKAANAIYEKYDDDKFTGNDYGYIGESYNG